MDSHFNLLDLYSPRFHEKKLGKTNPKGFRCSSSGSTQQSNLPIPVSYWLVSTKLSLCCGTWKKSYRRGTTGLVSKCIRYVRWGDGHRFLSPQNDGTYVTWDPSSSKPVETPNVPYYSSKPILRLLWETSSGPQPRIIFLWYGSIAIRWPNDGCGDAKQKQRGIRFSLHCGGFFLPSAEVTLLNKMNRKHVLYCWRNSFLPSI